MIAAPNTTRAWRKHVARLFGSASFFAGLTGRTLRLWARLVNAWLCLETPKASMALLLAGKMGITAGIFASRLAEAKAQAHLRQRVAPRV